MTNAIVLLSGGIDSAVCLKKATQEHPNVEAVHYDYGQQTEEIERANAERLAEEEGVPLQIIDYTHVFQEFAEGTIEDKQYQDTQTTEDGHSVGYVPQRNLHLLVSAAALAEHRSTTDTDIVLYHGAQNNDEADYPDCRPEFIEEAQDAINRSTDQHQIEIRTPLLHLSKTEVVELGDELDVDWSLTFSCYNDTQGKPCGECPACLERREAFEKAEVTDPVE